MAEPPAPEELWEEILLRLPPDDPASLLRASLVCKLWRRIVLRRGFLRRLAEHHRAPPMLGFFYNESMFVVAGFGFVPTTASSLPSPVLDFPEQCRVLDCRHGRVLLLFHCPRRVINYRPARKLLVWEPITGYQRLLPDLPKELNRSYYSNAAVMCAVDDCNHYSCQGGPFRVVAVYTQEIVDEVDRGWMMFASACVYSSETGAWGETTSVKLYAKIDRHRPSILVGNFLYVLCCACSGFTASILKYDPQGHTLAVIRVECWNEDAYLMQAEDGGLGFVTLSRGKMPAVLKLFSWNEESWVEAPWVPRRTIHVEDILSETIWVVGFAEGANIILLTTSDAIFMVELNSGRARNVCGNMNPIFGIFPLLDFYFPCGRSGIHANSKE